MGSYQARSVYLTTRLLGRLSPLAVKQYCAHSFTRNWQLPFLDQRKGENDRRKYFMINLHERMLPTSVGIEPATSWSPVGRASNWATEASPCLFDYRKLTIKWNNSKSPFRTIFSAYTQRQSTHQCYQYLDSTMFEIEQLLWHVCSSMH